MDKVLELLFLVILALGSALFFSITILWKFLQAIYQLILVAFKSS